MKLIQISEGQWVNVYWLKQINLLQPEEHHPGSGRVLQLHMAFPDDHSHVYTVIGLWVGSVMVQLGMVKSG